MHVRSPILLHRSGSSGHMSIRDRLLSARVAEIHKGELCGNHVGILTECCVSLDDLVGYLFT